MPSAAVDLSEFEEVAPARRNSCWFAALDDTQREKVAAAKVGGHSYKTISKVIVKWGVGVSASSVGNHFNGSCRCD